MNQEPRIPKVAPRRNRQNNGKQLSQEYLEYMESDAWRDLRNRKYTENGYRCQACGVKYNDTSCLEIHHTHYDTFTFEDTSDLLVLCLLCHDVIGMIREMRKTQYRIVDPHIKAVRLEASLELDHIEDFILRFDPYLKEEGQRWDLFKEYRTKIAEYYDSIGWDVSGPTLGLEYHSFLCSEEDPEVNVNELTRLFAWRLESEPLVSVESKDDDEETTVEKQEEPTLKTWRKAIRQQREEWEPGRLVSQFHDESHIFGCGFMSAEHQDIIDEYLETVIERIRDEVDRNHHRFGKIGRNRLRDIALGENGVDLDAEELFNLIKSLKTESGEVLGTIKRTKDMPLTWREGLTQQQDFNIRLLYLAVHGHIGIKKLVRGSKSVELSFIDGCLEKETVDDRDMESLRLRTDESLKTVLNKKETSTPPPKEEKNKTKSRMSRWLTVTKDLMFNTFRLKYK